MKDLILKKEYYLELFTYLNVSQLPFIFTSQIEFDSFFMDMKPAD